jgi:hypothetical protein
MPPLLALALAALAQAPSGAASSARAIPLDAGWELTGQLARIEQHRGVQAIRLRNGSAVRRDVALQDGTIEFDVELTPHRSFVYLTFRMEADEEYEEIYFRPHKTSLPDAVQYSPVWRGVSNWQLYHGAWGTARVPLPHDRWMHVRLVVQGRRAALFTGVGNQPDLIIRLGREPAPGYLGFGSFTPAGGAPEGIPVGSFANLVVQPGHVPFAFPPEPRDSLPPGTITRWQLSSPFPAELEPITTLPSGMLAGQERWRSFPVEPNGVLVVDRHLQRPRNVSGLVARLVLRASATGPQRLYLGYSDLVTVFLRGRPVFAGDARYSFDRPRQEGLIGTGQATIWLPLERGDNEVHLALTDGFGGWGLTARLDPADGARLVAPAR